MKHPCDITPHGYFFCRFSYRPPLYPYLSSDLAPMFLPFLSATCSLYARYLSGQTPNIYRTSTGHLPNINGR